MKLSVMRRRALAALSRFDNAHVEDLALAVGCQPRHMWAVTKWLVEAKLATREQVVGMRAFFNITDAGRTELTTAGTLALAEMR